ncbi:pVI protein [Amniota adenovirus 1]|nr:pVI protein [Amniota adenovirus 1]
MSVTSFSRLAPHKGMFPVMGVSIGNSDMRGGFSWGGLFSGISSGLSRVGNFIGSSAKQIGNSQAFQQVKNGVIQSGVLENAGNLAGSAVSGLVDIGRLKLERDLDRLREKAIGLPDQKVVYPSNSLQNGAVAPSEKLALPSVPDYIDNRPTASKPIIEEVPAMQPEAVPLGPYIPPRDEPPVSSSGRRVRKRKRPTVGWGAALNGMMGSGPGFYKRRYCF